MLIVLQLAQLAGSIFQLSITPLEKNILPNIQSKSFLKIKQFCQVGHRTLWHQDISAPGLFGTGADLVPQCVGHFGTTAENRETLWHQDSSALVEHCCDIECDVDRI